VFSSFSSNSLASINHCNGKTSSGDKQQIPYVGVHSLVVGGHYLTLKKKGL
jgi:hypothetical protein